MRDPIIPLRVPFGTAVGAFIGWGTQVRLGGSPILTVVWPLELAAILIALLSYSYWTEWGLVAETEGYRNCFIQRALTWRGLGFVRAEFLVSVTVFVVATSLVAVFLKNTAPPPDVARRRETIGMFMDYINDQAQPVLDATSELQEAWPTISNDPNGFRAKILALDDKLKSAETKKKVLFSKYPDYLDATGISDWTIPQQTLPSFGPGLLISISWRLCAKNIPNLKDDLRYSPSEVGGFRFGLSIWISQRSRALISKMRDYTGVNDVQAK